MRRSRLLMLVVAATMTLAITARADTALPVVGGPLLDAIAAMPEGQWKRVNRNLYSDAWTPAELRPLNHDSNEPPWKIIDAWSGYAWDSRRGDVILYGGGHANYSGNDVYRWRSTSMSWERASLPSEIAQIYATAGFMAIDGADHAPASAHTYDNNIYLPVIDRFLTWGGALYNTGSAYIRPDEANPGLVRKTGPYLFDPDRADSNKVGGSTGSHVQRVAPHPEVVGGNMWQNRDLTRNLAGRPLPDRHVNGCTAYAEENGKDVVYVGAPGGGGTNLDLFRYVINDVATPTTDEMDKVGIFWRGTSNQTTCAYDASRKLFVRTGSNTIPFLFWDLHAPGSQNEDQRVDVNASIVAFTDWLAANSKNIINCALDFDPGDDSFAVWCGGSQVWKLRPPPIAGTAAWTIDAQPSGGDVPFASLGTGILGKWKYVPGFDVFMALEDKMQGNIYVYKPVGWTPPVAGDPVNWMPEVFLQDPVDGGVFDLGVPIVLRAAASDPDGAVTKVEFLANGVRVGSVSTSPFTLSWLPPAYGHYALRARAFDNAGAEGLSATAAVDVLPPNTPPIVALTMPVDGAQVASGALVSLSASASDPDGTVVKVEFLVNGSKIGEALSAPFTLTWTAGPAGSYSLAARAIDNDGAATVSAGVGITVTDVVGTTVTLQQGSDGYLGTTDTLLSSYSPTTNFGNNATLLFHSSEYADLIRFAVFASEGGPVPDGATIESASLQIYKDVYNYVYRLYPMLKAWDESQATWVLARTGTAWTVPGAMGAGTDYGTQYDAEFSAPFNPGWMSFDVTNRLRTIASGGSSNLGWNIIGVSGNNNNRKLYSSEYAIDPSLRPKLVITYSTGSPPTNLPPIVALTMPVDGAQVASGALVSLSASASDPDGTVVKVEFLVNGSKIGEALSAPFTLTWTAGPAGSYSLAARAIDNDGAATVSAGVGITVTDVVGTTVTLQQGSDGYLGTTDTLLSSYSPTTNFGNNATLLFHSSEYADLIRFAVFASEGGPVPDGATIESASLQIYKDVYNYVYRLYPMLKAWDESQATWVLARTGTAWTVPGAMGAGTDYGTQYDAEFSAPFNPGWMSFDVTNRLRTIASGGSSNLGWNIIGVSGNNNNRKLYSSEYAIDPSLRPKLVITYSTGSPPTNLPPIVALTMPVDGAQVASGALVSLSASASDPDGTVVKVEFLVNGSKIGEALSAPFTLTWTAGPAGSYSLAARAIDNDGAATVSAGVGITVTDVVGTTVTLQQGSDGYLGTTDTLLSSYSPTTNFGNNATLLFHSSEYADLIRFAVFASEGGPVPDGATIESASLQIYKDVYNYVYRLYPMLKAWDESQATWVLARTGTAWTVPGAMGAGTDYGTQYDAEFSAPFNPGWMSFDVTNRLRTIASGGSSNLGWNIIGVSGNNNNRKLYSSEYAIDPSLRPKLVITYLLP